MGQTYDAIWRTCLRFKARCETIAEQLQANLSPREENAIHVLDERHQRSISTRAPKYPAEDSSIRKRIPPGGRSANPGCRS